MRPLESHSWDGFAAMVERHNGVFGGCWCTWFHTLTADKERTYDANRSLKRRLVDEGRAHAALVYDGDEVVAWCEYGSPQELPNLYHRKQYGEELHVLPDYRITCIFVDKPYRRQGLSAVALRGALDLTAEAGGGIVEGYPHDNEGKKKSVLYSGTRALFERAWVRVHPQQGGRQLRHAPHRHLTCRACPAVTYVLGASRGDTRSMISSPPQSPDEEIRLAAYDPRWADLFANEESRLADVIGRWATGGIHHVGSTAVPGLVAKPVIDILVGVDGLEESLPCLDLLAPLEYLYFPYLPYEMQWLCKPNPSRRTHHLHLVPTGSERFTAELSFRDYLRTHAARSREYEQLKRTLATSHRHDREAYTAGKAEFVQATLDLAESRW